MSLKLFVQIFLAALAVPLLGHAAIVLRVDVNDSTDAPTDTAPAYSAYTLSDESLSVGSYTVEINPANGAALDDVHRATPVDGGSLTLAPLYRDCIFAEGDNTANYYRVGLDAVIGGLTAGKRYTLTVWSYDSGSTGARTSDWSVLGLGGPQFAANDYSFNGATLPAADTANRFTVTACADTNGTLTLRGRPAAQTAADSVFLSGFTVDELSGAAASPATVLALDFNDRGSAGAGSTQPGFTEFLLTGTEGTLQTTTSRTFGAQTVTINAIGGNVDDRRRTTPVDAAPFTESQLLRDFLFATNSAQGLDVRVQGLEANASYLVEVWSYDSASLVPMRASDWAVNGAFLWDDYGFNGNSGAPNLPATNNDYKMAGVFTADASGELLLSGRGSTAQANVFLNALRVSLVAGPPVTDFGHPIISEFMAENSSGITDEDGDTSDWIEIWNTTASTLNLEGWRLTDNAAAPAQWVFPAGVTVPAQGFLRVWASEKNRLANPAALHTNFALSKTAGAYLALSNPSGAIVTQFTNIPGQRANVSYGLFGESEPQTAGYFTPATPLAPNANPPVPGFVADTNFSVSRGFFTNAQNVLVTCATTGATIYYTTDGREPTTASAIVPAGGISIATTTVLRAKAFAPPLAPSNTDTQTYIFNEHVQNQPAAPAGWPANWGINSEVNSNDGAGDGTVPADYEMDPNVVGSTLANYGVTDALAALPALSIAMDPADFLGANGIYQNPQSVGDLWERACSFEYLEPTGGGTHTNCGIRVHGNSSRRPFRMQKHSFRLAFRTSYGDGKLDFKLFDDTTVKEFNRLVLHAFFTDGFGLVSWDAARYRPETALMFRDPFVKRCFADMGHPSVSGRYVHLYINGLYWGVYEMGERVDETWCADHLGGIQTDWDVIAPDTTTAVQLKAGDLTAWNHLFTLVNAPDLTVPANYEAVAAQMDLVNFVDYYLLHIHADAEDWPHHNGYAIRSRTAPGAKWRFIPWDQEIAFDPLVLVNRYSVGAGNTTGNASAPLTFGVLYQKLRASAEFRLLFADRVHKHLNNGGALSLAIEQARWQSFADLLDKAIVAESARWGDAADATPYGNSVLPANITLKRETHWLPQVDTVKNSHMPALHNTANSYATITELRSQSPRLYPLTVPPEFSQFGGNVPANHALTITAPAGQIYYTTNGMDPRTAYTGAASGTLYTGPVTLTATGVVKARTLNAGEWSALTEAAFIVGTAASPANLTVTELNYNPAFGDAEFIELMNVSAGVIDLTGVHFEGITFTFADGTLLNAGERICIARNLNEFDARYGSIPRVVGPYTGALDNTGEEIAVIAANDTDIVRFRYNDKAPWPTAADGAGRSLVLRRPSAANNTAVHLNDAANWRASTVNGGNPGGSDRLALSGAPLDNSDTDAHVNLLEYLLYGSDAQANDILAPTVVWEPFTVNAVTGSYLTITTTARPGTDDATLEAEFSTDLATWQPAVYLGETATTRKWRAPVPSGGARQFLRLRGIHHP